jgi:hypothetical protein
MLILTNFTAKPTACLQCGQYAAAILHALMNE